MISEEVRMLHRRDMPSPIPRRPAEDPSEFAVGPHGLADEPASGRMGENTSAEREGPYNQGVGRVVRSFDDEGNDSAQVRGVRSPASAIEEPREGGASVLLDDSSRGHEPARTEGEIAASELAKPDEASAGNSGKSRAVQEQYPEDAAKEIPSARSSNARTKRRPRVPAPGIPFEPFELDKTALLHSGHGTSTIAGGNFGGVIRDRMRLAFAPGQSVRDTARTSPALTVHKETSRMMKQKFVNGIYDEEGPLQGQEKHKNPVLNQVARMGLRNPTYLPQDSARLLRKVQSLLPTIAAARPPARSSAKSSS